MLYWDQTFGKNQIRICLRVCWEKEGENSLAGLGVERFFCMGGLLIPIYKQGQLHTHKSQVFSDSPPQHPANRPRQLFSTSMDQIPSKTRNNTSHCFQSAAPLLVWAVGVVSAERHNLRYSPPVSMEKGRRKIFYFWNTQKPICGVEMILVNSAGCSLQAN